MYSLSTEKEKEFQKFFNRQYPKIKGFAISILKTEEDAEDIAQDVFIKLWDMPERWNELESSKGYIYSITKNHIFNFLRTKKYARHFQEKTIKEAVQHEEFDISDHLYAKEIQLITDLIVEKMPEQRKKVFFLSRKEGKSNQEIAELLQLSVRTVERHLYLALSEIKKVLLLFFLIFIE